MKYTLLQLVQQILASMQGDEITSIIDTEESRSVALIVKENYFYITGRADLPEHNELYQLTETSASTPTLMAMPTDSATIEWVKYNHILSTETDNNYQYVKYMSPEAFLEMLNSQNSDESFVAQYDLTIDSDTFSIKHRIDKQPEWWTTWNDAQIVFDSYDATEDSFLRKTKTMVYGQQNPVWTHTDAAVPDLDVQQFSLLLQESKAQCFSELKQVTNTNAERKLRHGWVDLSRTKQALPDNINAYSKIKGMGRKRK